jgi:hypothetical protein
MIWGVSTTPELFLYLRSYTCWDLWTMTLIAGPPFGYLCLFGNLATSLAERPVALRPRLATGLPFRGGMYTTFSMVLSRTNRRYVPSGLFLSKPNSRLMG